MMNDDQAPASDLIDTLSPTWRATRLWAEGKRVRARAKLESRRCPHGDAEYERGVIDAMNELLALPEPSKVDPEHSRDPYAQEDSLDA